METKREALHYLERKAHCWALAPLRSYLAKKPDDIHALSLFISALYESPFDKNISDECSAFFNESRSVFSPYQFHQFVQAEEARVQGHFENSLEAYEKSINGIEPPPAVRMGIAETLSQIGEDAKAISTYSEIVEQSPSYLPALVGMTELSFRIGRFDIVEKLVNLYEEQNTELAFSYFANPDKTLSKIAAYRETAENLREAISSYRENKRHQSSNQMFRIFRRHPTNYPIITAFTSICGDDLKIDTTDITACRILQRCPAELAYLRARLHFFKSEYEEALAAISEKPGKVLTNLQQGNTEKSSSDGPTLRDDTDKIIHYGSIQFALGNEEEAVRCYELALRKAPWHGFPRLRLAISVFEAEEFGNAFDLCEKAPNEISQLVPYGVRNSSNLKNIQALHIRTSLALGDAAKARKLMETFPHCCDTDTRYENLMLALVEASFGKKESAVSQFLVAASSPDELSTLLNFQDIQFLRKNIGTSSTECESILLLMEGICRSGKGHFSDAVRLLKQHTKSFGQSPIALAHIAKASAFFGKKHAVRNALAKIPDLETECSEIRSIVIDAHGRIGDTTALLAFPQTLSEQEKILFYVPALDLSERQRTRFLELCDHVLHKKPDSKSALVARFVIKNSDGTLSSKELSELITSEPFSMSLQKFLARKLFDDGKYSEARNCISELDDDGVSTLDSAVFFAACKIAEGNKSKAEKSN